MGLTSTVNAAERIIYAALIHRGQGRVCAASSLVLGTGPGHQASPGAAAAAARNGPQTVTVRIRKLSAPRSAIVCAPGRAPPVAGFMALHFIPGAASPATPGHGILAANAPFADVSVIFRRAAAISLTPMSHRTGIARIRLAR